MKTDAPGTTGRVAGPDGPFSDGHLEIFLGTWLAAAALALAVASRGPGDTGRHPGAVAAATAGTLLGPMTGAASRGLQRCCLASSLALLPYCLAALAGAALAQVLLPAGAAPLRPLRLLIWAAGLVAWFGGGIASLGHALS